MKKPDNYAIQASQAKARFLTYDAESIIRKFHLEADDRYLYTTLFSLPYRVERATGCVEKKLDGQWVDGNSHAEVLTLFDLLCDSREDRHLSGRWQSMQNFGLMFHQNLLESKRDPDAQRIQDCPEQFHRGCRALGGEPIGGADICYRIEVFDGLPIALQFWFGDDEFAPRLRYLWDANALQYLRYETMYFAVGLLMRLIALQVRPSVVE